MGEITTGMSYETGSRSGAADSSCDAILPAPTYAQDGAGARIRYVAIASDLGVLVVAGTAAGVCSLWMADEEAPLVEALRRQFPRADLSPAADDDAHVRQWARASVEITQGRGNTKQVPVDVAGTPFQRRVWAALREIPRGQTRSYAQVAAAIGRPAACRAVAGACGANRVGLIIPCHRVIRENGGLGGFAAGIERKKLLLERERAFGPTQSGRVPARSHDADLFSIDSART